MAQMVEIVYMETRFWARILMDKNKIFISQLFFSFREFLRSVLGLDNLYRLGRELNYFKKNI